MTSDPEDPHRWTFDCGMILGREGVIVNMKVWWFCQLCKTNVRASSEVTRRPHSMNVAYDKMAALSTLRARANAERASVHPRCSEIRLIKHVMES
jgi:hypothetical protein